MSSRTKIELPEEALADLLKIASVEDSHFDSLLTAIQATEPTLRGSQFASKVAGKVPFMEPSIVSSILAAAAAFYRVMRSDESSPREIAVGIAESSLISQAKGFTLDKRQILSARIVKLLECDKSIGVTAKAFDVMTESERVFCHARILSDIRPVFATSSEIADGAVIIHNLQIGFQHNGNHREMYLALDISDIKQLKLVIDRAEKKDLALQSMIRKSQVSYLEP